MSQLQSQSRTKPTDSGGLSKAIPVQMTEMSTFDDSFSFLKERFTAEMKRMDEEMNKFSSDLIKLYSQSSSDNPTMNWETLAESPLIQGEGENMQLKLQFDLSQFDPTEIKVRYADNVLVVTGVHSEKNDTTSVMREFRREFLLPKGTDPNTVKSFLSREGVLWVQAPLPQITPAVDNTLLSSQDPSKIVSDAVSKSTPEKDDSENDSPAKEAPEKPPATKIETKKAQDEKPQEKKTLHEQKALEIREKAAKPPSAQTNNNPPQRGASKLSKTSKK